MPDGSRGSAGKVEGTVTFGARGDPLLVLAAGQPGDHAGGQGGRRAQDRGQFVRAQLRPAFLDSAGLEPGDDLPSALLLLRGRVRFQAGPMQPVVRPGGLRCVVRGGGGGQVPVICCGPPGRAFGARANNGIASRIASNRPAPSVRSRSYQAMA